METYILCYGKFSFPSFIKKKHWHQRDKISAKDQTNRNKYILNNKKTVISHFHPWLLRNRISWVVAPSGWVIFSLYFEQTYRLHVQGNEEIHGFIIQKMKTVRPFDTAESNYPTTR
jgi:hypothetical protein